MATRLQPHSSCLLRQSRLTIAVTVLALLQLLSITGMAIAHAGHGKEFKQGGGETNQPIAVDATTAKRLGVKVEPVKPQQLDIGLKTTGQIEMLPDRHAEVTAPVKGKVVSLLVEPGSIVRQGQPIATMTSGELSDLRVSTQEKRAEALANLQQAQVNLNLAQENYRRYRQIAQAEISGARENLKAAQAQYARDRGLVKDRSIVKVAQTNYQRQVAIARSEIAQVQVEVNVAQERYNQDRQLFASGAVARRQMMESEAQLAAAKSKLAKAKSRPEVLQAESELRKAEVDLPIRAQQESASKLAEAQAAVTKALTQKEVIAAEAELKRAQANLAAAQTKLRLSDRSYQTRLQQLGTPGNSQGLVTVTAPISGVVADRAVSIGQSLQDTGAKLMTIVNDDLVLATANIYEKDLSRVREGQKVYVRVASLPGRLFTGTISRMGTVVGEGRVVPVQARLENAGKLLKPGMFAELELVTDRTSQALLTIPTTAIVEANEKKIVYVESGNSFQAVQVTLGQITGDRAEVKTGLFAGDRIVTQRGMLLYTQSLRVGSQTSAEEHEHGGAQPAQTTGEALNPIPPWGWAIVGSGATVAIGSLGWGLRRRRIDGNAIARSGERFDPNEVTSVITGILEEVEPEALPPPTQSVAGELSTPSDSPVDRALNSSEISVKIRSKRHAEYDC